MTAGLAISTPVTLNSSYKHLTMSVCVILYCLCVKKTQNIHVQIYFTDADRNTYIDTMLSLIFKFDTNRRGFGTSYYLSRARLLIYKFRN